jgi:putative nucleotidyltransferase with HDIG domain
VGGGIHHGEDVYTHNLISGNDISPKFPLIKLSGFLHDVGKPISKRLNPNTGNVWFEGHADTGVEILEQELRDLTFSNEEIATITGLVKLHMRISFGMGPKAIRKLLRNLSLDCLIGIFLGLDMQIWWPTLGNLLIPKALRTL